MALKREIIIISPENTIKYLRSIFSLSILQNISDEINAITREFKGDGSGLNASQLSDRYMRKKLEQIIPSFKEINNGEADWSINYHDLSFKKISGKSVIALDWSKNPEGCKPKDLFQCDIMLMVSNTSQWWKKCPKDVDAKIDYSKIIKKGIYIIDKFYCKNHVTLTSNNKSNTIIVAKQLYLALIYSFENDLFIEMPETSGKIIFNILKAFD